MHFPVSAEWQILRIWGKYRHGRRIIYPFTLVLKISFVHRNKLPVLNFIFNVQNMEKTGISNLRSHLFLTTQLNMAQQNFNLTESSGEGVSLKFEHLLKFMSFVSKFFIFIIMQLT